jgi:hypothetical protein
VQGAGWLRSKNKTRQPGARSVLTLAQKNRNFKGTPENTNTARTSLRADLTRYCSNNFSIIKAQGMRIM